MPGRNRNRSKVDKTEPEKVTVSGSIERQINRYYLKISRKYMTAAVLTLLVLVLYIICVTVFFGEYVTYDNLKYLLRDIDATDFSNKQDFDKIVYNAGGATKTAYFKNGLALCDANEYKYYDTAGTLLLDETLNYTEPILVPSEKYMLVYDLGGNGYSVFNQLTRIIERQAEGSIIAGNIAPDGSFVLAMRSNETKYVVEVYNGGFSKVMSIYKDNYVLDTGISPDGNTVVICSACPSESDFDCEIDICRRGKTESIKKIQIPHSIPLDVYAAGDGFAVLCSGKILFLNKNGEIINETVFSGMSLKYSDINESKAAIVGTTNMLGSENRVIVYDMKDDFGEIIFDKIFSEHIMGVFSARDPAALVYLKFNDTTAALSPDGEITSEKITGEIISIVPMKTGALICTETSAKRAYYEE